MATVLLDGTLSARGSAELTGDVSSHELPLVGTLSEQASLSGDIYIPAFVNGASIINVDTVESSAPGEPNVIIFTLTDGSTCELTVYNGVQGATGNDGMPGERGSDGVTFTPVVGDVSTLPPGSEASASVDIIGENAVFTFGIPAGIAGDYDGLSNKPLINSVELQGDKSFSDLGLESMTNREIESLFT